MDSKQLIKEKVRLTRKKTDFNNLAQAYQGRVLDIESNKIIIRAVKVIKDLNLSLGKGIQVIYVNDAKGIHYFKSQILNIDDPIIQVNKPNLIQKSQRREFVRVKYETDVEFSPISYKGENLTHLEDKKGIGQMVDLSAGGICFISDIELIKELVIELRVTLGEDDFQILGEIVRVIEKEEGYEIGVKFDLENKRIADQISNFVFQEQIRQRRKNAK
ncbi:flagellar brake protein [Sporohalobacter salinus]|uniref:flagellar brake protein n=1 Tax=Sporohalobacter salinus TaxID=1494606 RepID=UPI00196153A5|nr:PilZ domain-containing protein [Sporohalobacter salinus]MBM7624523.1 c-di-GMP-binding flagellar brake protein YcgR [Sporohalobacter salinus]